MSNEYTPTTETVRDVYATAVGLPEAPKRRAWFDRWLSEHDEHVISKYTAENDVVPYERYVKDIAQVRREAKAEAWDEGYQQGVEDEQISEANIGIAGFGMKVNPARNNPYRADQEGDE